MKRKKIVLQINIRKCDREKFVDISSQYAFPIYIVSNNGLTHVEAKSLLGVISVADTINDCKLEITSNKEQQQGVSEYINRIKDFTI